MGLPVRFMLLAYYNRNVMTAMEMERAGMKKYTGKSVYKGIAMGPLSVLKKTDDQVKRSKIEDPEAEIVRVTDAIGASKAQLQKLYDKALKDHLHFTKNIVY